MTTSSKTLFLRPTTRQELIQLIHKLPNKSSSGYDKVSNIILKHLVDEIVHPLEIIFNKSLYEVIFPNNMKQADVVPLYKSRDKQECINYRPISLLITLSKI